MNRYWMRNLAFLLGSIAVGGVARAQDEAKEPAQLTIGSKAPALEVAHWVQDGNGKFKPVEEFEPDKVYIVEFWATWCGPCIMSMPHLAETQIKHEKDVQIISISDETLETVEAFLGRKVQGEDEKTYRELTSTYCLTTDPDRSNHVNYMQAARQNGIPTAFIVGKDGHVEWIGHPMSMDQPLDEIVADKWDREAFAEVFAAQQRVDEKMAEVSAAMRGGDAEGALKILDELIADSSKEGNARLMQIKLSILLSQGGEGVVPLAKTILSETEDGPQLNEFAWSIYRQVAAGAQVSSELISIGVEAAEKSVANLQEGQMRGYALDTLAHLKHHQGHLDQAIQLQTKAVAEAPEEQLKAFLEQLRKEKEEKEKEDDKQ